MLSKSRGHVLRLAVAFHVLFHLGKDNPVSVEVSEEAVKAAVDFVNISCQQTAFIAGRGPLQEEFERFKNNGIATMYSYHKIRCCISPVSVIDIFESAH